MKITLFLLLVFAVLTLCWVSAPSSCSYEQQVLNNHLFHPGYSWCGRCGKTWDVVNGHDTMFKANEGCFPLCEKCWHDLKTPQARLPYYRKMFDEWRNKWGRDESDWPLIRKAVLEGK